jgi:hypothetical protein
MTVHQRLNQMERQIRQQRIGLFVLAAALCGVVSMAATERQDGVLNTVIAKKVYAKDIFVTNDEGEMSVIMTTYNGAGSVTTFSQTGKMLVDLVTTSNGGKVEVFNKTGEGIITLETDDYGNGEVGAWNRKGKGRVWRSQ